MKIKVNTRGKKVKITVRPQTKPIRPKKWKALT